MATDNARYTIAELSAIIRHGLQASKTETIDHQDLVEIGREFGLDKEEIEAAVGHRSFLPSQSRAVLSAAEKLGNTLQETFMESNCRETTY